MKLTIKKAVVVAILLGASVSVNATLEAATEAERQQYEEKARQSKQKSEELSQKIASVSEEKRLLDAEADEAIALHQTRKAALNETEGRIAENEEKLGRLQEDYKRKTEMLGVRVRDIYVNGQISYIDVLFGAKDFGDFMTRMDLLKRVMRLDYDLVQIVLQERDSIREAQKKLEADRVAQAELELSAREARFVMEEKVRKREALIEKMKYDKTVFDKQYEEFMAASRQVEQMIRNSAYRVTAPAGGSGAMIWPLSGPITSPFGWRTHPIYGNARFHSGIDIGGDYGDPIYAARAGVVSYAGWISGYGNAVMIDHGGGVTTLYGHCQSLNVSEGQSVAQGQLISRCGSTGNSTGPHCHFEVRENGSPVNPMGYL